MVMLSIIVYRLAVRIAIFKEGSASVRPQGFLSYTYSISILHFLLSLLLSSLTPLTSHSHSLTFTLILSLRQSLTHLLSFVDSLSGTPICIVHTRLCNQLRAIIVIHSAAVISAITAAVLNLVAIQILNFMYRHLAVEMTNWENHRKVTIIPSVCRGRAVSMLS